MPPPHPGPTRPMVLGGSEGSKLIAWCGDGSASCYRRNMVTAFAIAVWATPNAPLALGGVLQPVSNWA
jgi:hypothetical protein